MAETWNVTTINGKRFLVVDTASFRIPLDWDPASNMFIAVAAPSGGYGNLPALLKGDTGDPATLDSTVDLTVLDYDDPTADSASFADLGGGLYQAHLTLHEGRPGVDGTATLNPTDYGTPAAGKILVVNAGADGFVYKGQLAGDRYLPASIASVGAGNPAYTLCSVAVTGHPFDWRPEVSGQCVITGTGANVVVDLLARLNDSSSGNIVGRGVGVAGKYPANQILVPGPPAGSADGYDRVSANTAATIYLRTERTSGTDTFTTSNTTTTFSVRVCPVPGTGV